MNLEILPPQILELGGESKVSSTESGVGEPSFAEQKQFSVFQARFANLKTTYAHLDFTQHENLIH